MNIEIIPANSSQLEDYYILFSSEQVCKYMDIDCFKNKIDAKIFLDFSEVQNKNNKSRRFSIKSNNEIIGTVCIYSIYWHQHRASIGYALKEKYWNQGIMRNVLKQIELIVINDMNINRLQATVLQENLASKNVLKRCGFEYEGLLRQYEMWGSKGFVDLEMYSIILGRSG